MALLSPLALAFDSRFVCRCDSHPLEFFTSTPIFVVFLFYISKMTPCLRGDCSQPDNNKHRSKYGLLHRALIQTKRQAIKDPKIISVHNSNRKTNDLIYISCISKRENTNEQHQQTITAERQAPQSIRTGA